MNLMVESENVKVVIVGDDNVGQDEFLDLLGYQQLPRGLCS